MRIQELCGRHRSQDIYICGTGPSLRVTNLSFLVDRVTIGLNQFWRHLTPTYSITVHPELVLSYEAEGGLRDAHTLRRTKWIVKRKAPMADLKWADGRFYVFETINEDYSVLRLQPPDRLFLSKGIQCTALDMAVRMGAKNIFLVGTDMCSLGGEHHGHEQHVRFHGLDPDTVYKEYRYSTAKVRKVLEEYHGVNIMTLSPFLGVGAPEEDYARRCKEKGLPPLPAPEDTSGYKRETPKLG